MVLNQFDSRKYILNKYFIILLCILTTVILLTSYCGTEMCPPIFSDTSYCGTEQETESLINLHKEQLRADRIARFGTNQPDSWGPDSIQYCKLHQKYKECMLPKPLKTPDCEAVADEYLAFMSDVVDGKRNPSPWCK
jgi:hypothetical protein